MPESVGEIARAQADAWLEASLDPAHAQNVGINTNLTGLPDASSAWTEVRHKQLEFDYTPTAGTLETSFMFMPLLKKTLFNLREDGVATQTSKNYNIMNIKESTSKILEVDLSNHIPVSDLPDDIMGFYPATTSGIIDIGGEAQLKHRLLGFSWTIYNVTNQEIREGEITCWRDNTGWQNISGHHIFSQTSTTEHTVGPQQPFTNACNFILTEMYNQPTTTRTGVGEGCYQVAMMTNPLDNGFNRCGDPCFLGLRNGVSGAYGHRMLVSGDSDSLVGINPFPYFAFWNDVTGDMQFKLGGSTCPLAWHPMGCVLHNVPNQKFRVKLHVITEEVVGPLGQNKQDLSNASPSPPFNPGIMSGYLGIVGLTPAGVPASMNDWGSFLRKIKPMVYDLGSKILTGAAVGGMMGGPGGALAGAIEEAGRWGVEQFEPIRSRFK